MGRLTLWMLAGALLVGPVAAAESAHFRIQADSMCAAGGAAVSATFIEVQSVAGQMFDVHISASVSYQEDVGAIQAWDTPNAAGNWSLYE